MWYVVGFISLLRFRNYFGPLISHSHLPPFVVVELGRLVKGTARTSNIKAGDYFGHEVMVDHQKYLATVVSQSTITGWKIDRASLTNAVPADHLRKAAASKKEQK